MVQHGITFRSPQWQNSYPLCLFSLRGQYQRVLGTNRITQTRLKIAQTAFNLLRLCALLIMV